MYIRLLLHWSPHGCQNSFELPLATVTNKFCDLSWSFKGRTSVNLRPVISQCWQENGLRPWQQKKGRVCSLFWEEVTHVLTYADDKEGVFVPIWHVFNAVRHHTYRQPRTCAHTKAHEEASPTCSAGLPNYYQLLYINKPWHKSSDESAIPNTLEMLPRVACYRPSGQIGTRGEWKGRSVRGKLEGDREKVRDTQLITSYMKTYEDEGRAARREEKMTAFKL